MRRLPLEGLKIKEGRDFLAKEGFDESKIIVHAPYLLNLGNDTHKDAYEASIALLKEELLRSESFGASLLVLHPGNATGLPVEAALKSVSRGLDAVFEDEPTSVTICLETMAGKGSEVGTTFEQLASIIAQSRHPGRLGVCLDTCHINDAGMIHSNRQRMPPEMSEAAETIRFLKKSGIKESQHKMKPSQLVPPIIPI